MTAAPREIGADLQNAEDAAGALGTFDHSR